MIAEVVGGVCGNNLADGAENSNGAIVGGVGRAASLGEEKNIRLQPALRDIQTHEPFDQKIEPVLEELREYRNQIEVEIVKSHRFLWFGSPDNGLKLIPSGRTETLGRGIVVDLTEKFCLNISRNRVIHVPPSWERALLMTEQDSCGDLNIFSSLSIRAMGGVVAWECAATAFFMPLPETNEA